MTKVVIAFILLPLVMPSASFAQATVTRSGYARSSVTFPNGNVGISNNLAVEGTSSGLTGARSLQYVTPQMYGAAGDGTTDDTTALSNALNSGYPVKCKGTFRITAKITVSLNTPGKELSLDGAGRSACVIKEDGANAYIEVDLSYIDNPFGPNTNHVTLKHATLSPNMHVAHGAIELYGIAAAGSTEPTLYAEDFNVIPTSTSSYSDYGIYLKDMRNLTIASSVIEGEYGAFNGDGIHITSSTASAPVDFHLHDNIISWWNIGLDLAPNTGGTTTGDNDWEGAYVANNTFLADNYGISATTVDNSSGLLVVTGNHMNFSQYGIYAVDIQQLYASSNFFLDSSVGVNSPSTTYGIYDYMNNNVAQYGHLADNSFDFTGALSVKTRYDIYASQSGITPIATDVHDNTSIEATIKFPGTSTSPHDNTGF